MRANHAGYLDMIFTPGDLVALFEETMGDKLSTFDAFIGTGISGTVACAMLGQTYSKPFALVRKEGVNNHSCCKVETGLYEGRFLIVDDLVASGRTIWNIVHAMGQGLGQHSIAGMWLYNGNGMAGPSTSGFFAPHQWPGLFGACQSDTMYLNRIMSVLRQGR